MFKTCGQKNPGVATRIAECCGVVHKETERFLVVIQNPA